MTAILATIRRMEKPTAAVAAEAVFADAQLLATETNGNRGDVWRWLLLAAVAAMKADSCSSHAVTALQALYDLADEDRAVHRTDAADAAAYYFADMAKDWAKSVCGDDWWPIRS